MLPDSETSCIHIIVAWSTAVSSTWFGKARQNHRGTVHSRPSDSTRCPQRKKRAGGRSAAGVLEYPQRKKRAGGRSAAGVLEYSQRKKRAGGRSAAGVLEYSQRKKRAGGRSAKGGPIHPSGRRGVVLAAPVAGAPPPHAAAAARADAAGRLGVLARRWAISTPGSARRSSERGFVRRG